MSKKYTYEQVQDIVKNFGYVLISDSYVNNKQKLILKDILGYYYEITLANLKSYKKPLNFDIYNSFTIQNIKLWCKLNNKFFILLSDLYVNAKEYLEWKCLKEGCGENFKVTWSDIYQNEGCPFCAGRQIGLSNCLATKNPELASEWHPTLNGDLTPYDVTCNTGKKVWWQCSKNSKHKWITQIYKRNNRGDKCPYCSGKLPSDDYNLLICNPELSSEWNYAKNKKIPREYCPNANIKVWWKCKECDNEWQATINDRNGKRKNGCPSCNKSKGEKVCKDFYELHDIVYISQKTFDGLVGLGNGNLSYDFYLPQYNFLIEIQGQYHDGTVTNQTEEQFKKQQEHDKRKKEYANKNNIKLLEIWYWDFDRIEEILEKELKLKKEVIE